MITAKPVKWLIENLDSVNIADQFDDTTLDTLASEIKIGRAHV